MIGRFSSACRQGLVARLGGFLPSGSSPWVVLNGPRNHDPIVLAFFPNRPDRGGEFWIADRPDSNPDRGGMLPGAGIDSGTTGWAKEGLECAACCGWPFKTRRLAPDPDAIVRIIGEHAEWRSASALTIATVTSNDRRAWTGQIDCKLLALAPSFHQILSRPSKL